MVEVIPLFWVEMTFGVADPQDERASFPVRQAKMHPDLSFRKGRAYSWEYAFCSILPEISVPSQSIRNQRRSGRKVLIRIDGLVIPNPLPGTNSTFAHNRTAERARGAPNQVVAGGIP